MDCKRLGRGWRRLLIDQPFANGEANQLAGRVEIQLFHNAAAMGVDGVDAEVEQGRDVLVGLAFGD